MVSIRCHKSTEDRVSAHMLRIREGFWEGNCERNPKELVVAMGKEVKQDACFRRQEQSLKCSTLEEIQIDQYS